MTSLYACAFCSHKSARYAPSCENCKAFSSMKLQKGETANGAPRPMQARTEALARVRMGLAPLDRALGGGLVESSAILLSGAPGAGKSTLALHLAAAIPSSLYVTSEETFEQVEHRATRTLPSVLGSQLLASRFLTDILQAADPYRLIIIDSLHRLAGRVEENAGRILAWVKMRRTTLVAIAHVTKEDTIRGESTIEHLFDTTLFLDRTKKVEGEDGSSLRILRTLKNRYGAEGSFPVLLTGRGWTEPIHTEKASENGAGNASTVPQ
jgi:DNA repair protein RadA/Sms